jgi:hypothetical protein
MSSDVGAILSAPFVRLPSRDRPQQQHKAPEGPPRPVADEERAFTVDTINQRLASLAAARSGRALDITA